MDYTPYFATLRKTSLLRGMTDAELAALMASLTTRVRRYDKGELLLMAGYETKEVGMILEGEITATKPMPDGTPVTMARMGPGGVFADVLAGGRSKSPVNVTAASSCLVLYLPCAALLRPGGEPNAAQWKLLQTGWKRSAANILRWTAAWNCCAAKACAGASACGCWNSASRPAVTPLPLR